MLAAAALFANVTHAKNYKAALEQAAAEKKMVMVMLTREGCDACWYMENVVFEDKKIEELLNKDFVVLILDIHNDNLRSLDYIGTPTFHFLTEKGYKRYRLDGAANVKDFTDVLAEALKAR